MTVFILCTSLNVLAQESLQIDKDVVPKTIKDKKDNYVTLFLPESLNNAQCERRVYGIPPGVAGMFQTLYSETRRAESYEAAIRELCIQPGNSQSYLDQLDKSLKNAGVAVDDARFVTNIVKHGANSINKRYVKSGTLPANFHNRLAGIGRRLKTVQNNSAFAQACLAFENIKATAQLTETIAGAFILNSLSTDKAWTRLKEIERVVSSERQKQGRIDPALVEAIKRSEVNLLASRSKIGAFAVSVNDDIDKLTDSTMNLGATLAEMSAKFSAPLAMWVGAPLMTYNTLRGISNQWEMAQDGVTLATITKLIRKHSQDNSIANNIVSYGQYAFYLQMEETFATGSAKFKDFLSPGHTNKDWSQYYGEQKQNATVIIVSSMVSSSVTEQTLGLAGELLKPNPCNLGDKEEEFVAEIRISDICRVRNPTLVILQFRTKNRSLLERRGWYEISPPLRDKPIFKSVRMNDRGQRGDKFPEDGVYTYSRKLGFMGFAPGTYDIWVIVQNQIEAYKSKNPSNYAPVHIGMFLAK